MLASLNTPLLLILVPLVMSAAESKPAFLSGVEFERIGLSRYWAADLPLGADDTIVFARRLDEVLYVATKKGSLYALTADAGLLRWGVELTEPGYTVYAPVHVPTRDGTGPVVIPTTVQTFIIDKYTGRILGRFAAPYPPGSPIVALGDLVFTGSSNGKFYSQVRDPGGINEPRLLWEVQTGGPVTAAPALFGGNRLLFASQSGSVFACFAEDKVLLWSHHTGGPIVADPVVDDDGVYVASLDRSLYKWNRSTGNPIWRFRFPAPLGTGPVLSIDTVYQFCPRDGLSALDRDTGRGKWKNTKALKLAAHGVAGDVLFSADRRLELVDHETGLSLGSVPVQSAWDVVSNTRDDSVFLIGSAGSVLCLRLADDPYLRRQQVLAARRRLNFPPIDGAGASDHADRTPDQVSDRRSRDPLRSRRDVKP